jgi:hypothetical protein
MLQMLQDVAGRCHHPRVVLYVTLRVFVDPGWLYRLPTKPHNSPNEAHLESTSLKCSGIQAQLMASSSPVQQTDLEESPRPVKGVVDQVCRQQEVQVSIETLSSSPIALYQIWQVLYCRVALC